MTPAMAARRILYIHFSLEIRRKISKKEKNVTANANMT